MATITLTLSQDEIKQAVSEFVAKDYPGHEVSSLSVRTIPGDRPFDGDYTTATVVLKASKA